MKLSKLLKPWIDITSVDCEITGLHNDSRHIQKGFLFFAYPGALTDGRLYITQAIDAGAAAIVYEPLNWPSHYPMPNPGLGIALPDTAHHLAAIANRFYDEPSKKMTLTGVTGTNGKTTIAYQLAQAHELLSNPAVYIGTLGQGKVSSLQASVNTTPDALCLQHLFYNYHHDNIKQVCMEVSSHALALHRVDSIAFQQAIFTNLTLDHLDFHHTMEAYALAKASLFTYPSLQWAIVNNDDSYAFLFKNSVKSPCQLITYGIKNKSDVRAINYEVGLTGTHIDVDSPWGRQQITINALGFFNIYNALAIFSSLLVSGYEVNKVVAVMEKLFPASGRMEIVANRPYVIVDYAHTPDALENVLVTLNNVKRGKIIVVFGCGGDRDKSKRPIMGSIAERFADIAIVTSDNPRHEDAAQIIHEIMADIAVNSSKIYQVVDREAAIAKAINLACENDIVLVAGKGHEAYQQIGDIKYVFSDQEVIKRLIAK